jgi:hypothetical protein
MGWIGGLLTLPFTIAETLYGILLSVINTAYGVTTSVIANLWDLIPFT